MKGQLSVIAIASVLILFGMCATAQEKAEFGTLNVKDFGAKGDGKTDDTEPIQKALDASNLNKGVYGGGYHYTMPELVFPAGHYKVSKTLKWNAFTTIRGDGGKVMLEQTNPELDIIEYNGFRNVVKGMAFIGGRTALKMNTHNADSAMPMILNCQFYDTSGPAIILEGGSTLLSIEHCLFVNCEQALINRADMAVVKDCWISTSKKMKDKAVFVNYGVMHLEDILGVPRPNGSDQRWIDNYEVLRVSRFRFGGEGAGFTPVVNFGKVRVNPPWPRSVTLDQCYIYGLGNQKRQCAVYCEEIPNTITITDCTGLIRMALIKVNPKINIRTYLKDVPKQLLHFTFWGNVADNTAAYPIPKEMLPYTNVFMPKGIKKIR